jgi:acetyl esterase/lipase
LASLCPTRKVQPEPVAALREAGSAAGATAAAREQGPQSEGLMKVRLLFILVPMLMGCTDAELFIANTLARFDNYRLTADQPYGDHALNRLDVYQPEGSAKGTVIFFYGGCWGACTTYTKEHYRFVAQALTSRGYVAVIPDYRHYPEVLFRQMMEDSASVVAWVSRNSARFGGGTEPIFLMGHSAGGHLAVMLTVNERYLGAELHEKIRGFIGLAAPYDFIFDKPYLPKVFAEVSYPESQPSHFVDGKEPALLLLYGNEDTEVYPRNIVNMTKIVRRQGGEVESHIYSGVDHAGILAALSIPYRNRMGVMDDIAAFLDRHKQPRIEFR